MAAIDPSKLNGIIKDEAEGERVLFTEAFSDPPETEAPTMMFTTSFTHSGGTDPPETEPPTMIQTTSFTSTGTHAGTQATGSFAPSMAVTTKPKPKPPKPAVITGDPQ